MKKISFLFLLIGFVSFAQQEDSEMLDKMYKIALTDCKSYSWLDYLSNSIGSRLSGSDNAAKAVLYMQKEMQKLRLDSVYLQEVMVPKWIRGEKETLSLHGAGKKIDFAICALGMSVGTAKNGLLANVIEVQSLEELEKLGSEKIKGNIIFFNRPMNPEFIETGMAYGSCVDQRSSGAREAGKLGAVGVIVRSMNLRLDNLPHTGMTNYKDMPVSERIPAAAISTLGANQLSELLKINPNSKLFFKQSCRQEAEVLSYNVIGEIKGSQNPNKIMLVGGHLDSWDLGDGSQDDGAGCVQSLGVLELLKKINYKPKNTIRVVLFMNEENGVNGGKKYAEIAKSKKEQHLVALESDSGGFTPRGFSIASSDADFVKISNFKNLFAPYLIHYFEKGHSGTDIEPLDFDGIIKIGLHPDSQRYFDYHHAANDTFDSVNKRELELGTAAMASLLYLLDSKSY